MYQARYKLKIKMNQTLKIIPVVALCAGLLTACEQEVQEQPAPLRTVRTMTVEAVGASRVRSFTGVSKSTQEAKLSFKVSGTLTALNVAVGDSIDKGETIATLDPSTFQLQVQQSQADLSRSKAEERNAKANYKRVKGLYENESASRNDLDSARAGAESATAAVNALGRAVQLAQLNLSYTTLKAKDQCSVASTDADVGENINAGQQIVVVNCGESLDVEISVPENLIAEFQPGMTGDIRFNSIGDQVYKGEVTEVSIAASGTTFPVTIRVVDPANLRSGLAAQVGFEFDNQERLPVLPTSAVSEDQNGRFVYLLLSDADAQLQPGQGLIKRQTVSIGELIEGGIEVSAGIKPGDKVVTAGVSVIRDGLVVKTN